MRFMVAVPAAERVVGGVVKDPMEPLGCDMAVAKSDVHPAQVQPLDHGIPPLQLRPTNPA